MCMEVYRVWRITDTVIDVEGKGDFPPVAALRDLETGEMSLVDSVRFLRPGAWRLRVLPLRRDHNYELVIHGRGFFVDFSEHYWSQFVFHGWLGVRRRGKRTIFRLFAPRAQRVVLSLFEKLYQETEPSLYYQGEIQIPMHWRGKGVWEVVVPRDCKGYYYGYRVWGPKGPGELFRPDVVIADPYAEAVTSFLVCPQRHLGIIVEEDYVWESSAKAPGISPHEFIIYECHLRDMTMLSDCQHPGTYEGFCEENQHGGMAHLRELGVNTVEFLPLQEFCEIEPPFGVHSQHHIYNDFNPYSRNHWGYMTTSFFAPENYYLTGTIQPNTWNGKDGSQVRAMKRMVDRLHQQRIAVIMDVVYNHVSIYDYNALRLIDRRYYFWTTPEGYDDQRTYCGNDFKSDRPMARRLIVDSLVHWVKNYRIDGFRFDLGTVIDWQTYGEIVKRLRALKPNIFLTVEPWHGGRGGGRDGGDYCLLAGENRFSSLGITAWNDRFRNMVRGGTHAHEHPQYGLVFGKTPLDHLWEAVCSYPGIFQKVWHSVNYIESHDNHTFADFLRVGNGDIHLGTELSPDALLSLSKLTPHQLNQEKLAALVLFLSPGVVMIHEGQELGRMRVVYPPDGRYSLLGHTHWQKKSNQWVNEKHHPWPHHKARPWTIDGDGYEKDNPSNWINWNLKEVNALLYNYYKALIAFRKQQSWISTVQRSDILRLNPLHGEGLGWMYRSKHLSVFVNVSSSDASFVLPEEEVQVLFSTHPEENFIKDGSLLVLPPLRGVVLGKISK